MSERTAEQLQRDYYERTAASYENDHVRPGDEHAIAVGYIAQLARVVGAQSVLDVGAGTGRGVRLLGDLRPDLKVAGVEPVAALRAEAETLGTRLEDGSGQKLPFADNSFDFVMSTGVLHHVRDPRPVVAEMMRTARLGVMISDSNRFGQGGRIAKAAKVTMVATRTWAIYNWARTGGRGYMESDGDGIFYSYSVYDSMPAVSEWANRTFVIPTQGPAKGRLGAVLGASAGLLVGLREPY